MAEHDWPADTPRDEMLARVAARGTRIRAVRGAINALAILSVVGASAFGVNAAIGSMGDGSGGTEVENIAMVPEPPEVGPGGDDRPGGDDAQPPLDASTSTPGEGPVPTAPDGSAPDTTRGTGSGAGTGSGSATAPTRPGTGTSSPSRPSTTGRPTTTRPTASTTTTSAPAETAPKPEVGNVRMKADGVTLGAYICRDEPNSELAVEISDATEAKVSWNRAGETRTVALTAGDGEWTAPLDQIDELNGDVPVIVTIEATGPGGTTRTSDHLTVTDCVPLPSDPPVPGP